MTVPPRCGRNRTACPARGRAVKIRSPPLTDSSARP